MRWPWYLLGGALLAAAVAVVVLILVLMAALGDAFSLDEFEIEGLKEDLERLALIEQYEQRSITQEQFDALQLGSPRAHVDAFLGVPPIDRNAFASVGHDVRSECEYYGAPGGQWGGYELCYEDGVLAVKNAAPSPGSAPDEP